jgi:hypothetical protein
MVVKLRPTWAGVRTAALAYLLMGLPLTFMLWLVASASGSWWWPLGIVAESVGAGVVIWLFVRKLPSRQQVEEDRLRSQGWTPPPGWKP